MKYTEENFKKLCDQLNFTYIKYVIERHKTGKKTQYYCYVYFTCPEHEYKGVQKIYIEALQRWAKVGKCKCVSNYRHTTEDLKRDKGLNDSVKILGEYVKSNQKILCECKICGHQWYATPNHLQGGRGCPKCKLQNLHNKFVKSQEEFEAQIASINPNIEIIGEYQGGSKKIKYKCKLCGAISTSTPLNLLYENVGCHKCNSSKGENIISEFLDNYHIPYKRQYSFINCRYKEPLRFDFYIESLNLCIEYQGEQHYFPVNFAPKNQDNSKHEFKLNQIRDDIKRNYCNTNNISLLEVPYWDKNNTNDILLNYFKKYNLNLN